MPDYTVTNDWSSAAGTSLVGYLPDPTTFDELVSLFGEPLGQGDKTLAEWVVRFPNGVVATIYDWKNYGQKREDITFWHVGGHGKGEVELVTGVLEAHRASYGQVLIF